MSTLRVFLKWAGSIEAVPQNLYDKVMVPRVRPEERQRDETLNAEDAQEILEYLSKYEYASKEHAVMALLWQTGIRVGAAHSLDVDDVSLDENYVQLNHRPDEGTTLKNGKSGQRPVALTPDASEVLAEYIRTHRRDVTDDYGREPLFTTAHGRMHGNTIRRLTYRVTAPCYRGVDCPDCEGDESKCFWYSPSEYLETRYDSRRRLSDRQPLGLILILQSERHSRNHDFRNRRFRIEESYSRGQIALEVSIEPLLRD